MVAKRVAREVKKSYSELKVKDDTFPAFFLKTDATIGFLVPEMA